MPMAFSRSAMRKEWMLLALILVLSSFQHAAAARACEESGYCSTGISKHWVGDIKQSAQLRAMLEAVTFRKELVITIFQLSEQDQLWADQVGVRQEIQGGPAGRFLPLRQEVLEVAFLPCHNPALQLHGELQDMGYAHHLFITNDEASCNQLNTFDAVNCVWDSSDLPGYVLANEEALWHNRWKMIARASRLGYNIMSIDTDFMWFRDPYIHFKSAPFNQIQMFTVPEGGSVFNNNGGFMYVQNARPDGPVSWVFKQVAMSTLRRADDGYKYISEWTKEIRNCLSFDQTIIMDALVAAVVGRPVFPNALDSCKQGATFVTRAGNTITAQQASQNIFGLSAGHIRTRVLTVPPTQQFLDSIKVKFVPGYDTQMTIGNLTVPNLAWGYPEELGGRFAPLEHGNLSAAFTQQLKEDCPDCPWWPERRPLPPGEDQLARILGPKFDSPNVNNDNAWIYYEGGAPQETWAQVPRWLTCSLSTLRRGWVLGTRAPVQGPMVLGHVHSWHMQANRAHKAMIRKVLGRYNWTLGTLVAQSSGLANAYAMHKPVRRVLALSPDIDLSRTRSWEEFSSIIVGMMQVAFLSHRALVLPSLPCQTAWLHDPNTLTDTEAAPQLCVAPTFWRTPHRYPLPMTVAVDQRGELVGGWARRLRAQLTSGGSAIQQPVIPPTILEPDTSDAMETGPDMTSLPRAVGPQRRLSEVPDGWWEKQRYVLALPQLWDPSCTKDFHAITGPEFFHWLRRTDVGRTALTGPIKANTVLVASSSAESLELRPPSPLPGGDSAAVPAGSVVPMSEDFGWSLRDVQAAVPVAQVIEHMHLFEEEPLVFLGHPVMVVHSTTNTTLQQALQAQDMAMTSPGKVKALALHHHGRVKSRAAGITPEEALSAVNYHIRKGRCKATWVEPETFEGTPVNLGHGQPSMLVNGLIQPVQPLK